MGLLDICVVDQRCGGGTKSHASVGLINKYFFFHFNVCARHPPTHSLPSSLALSKTHVSEEFHMLSLKQRRGGTDESSKSSCPGRASRHRLLRSSNNNSSRKVENDERQSLNGTAAKEGSANLSSPLPAMTHPPPPATTIAAAAAAAAEAVTKTC